MMHPSHKLSIFQFELIPNVLDEERIINKCTNKLFSSIDFIASFVPSKNYDNPFQKCLTHDDPEDVSYGLSLDLYQSSYNVLISFRNMTFQQFHGYQMLSIRINFYNSSIKNDIFVVGCHFKGNTANLQGFSLINVETWAHSSKLTQCCGKTKIIIQNCSFIDNGYNSALVNITHRDSIGKYAKTLNLFLDVHIRECLFQTEARYFLIFHSYNFQQLYISNSIFYPTSELSTRICIL